MKKILVFVFLFFCFSLLSDERSPSISMYENLEIIDRIDDHIKDTLPFCYNFLLQGGTIVMPSARMAYDGDVVLGFSYLPPYQLWSIGFQYFPHLELSGNYWIYHGIMEKNFGDMGFGDDADRAANIKVSLLRRRDGIDFLPEIALGMNDCIGSKRFHSFYIVATKELLDQNLELTAGWGCGRIRGFFGSMIFSPWRRKSHCLKGLSFLVEYDANDYKHHKTEHPEGREVCSYINAGLYWKLFPFLDISISYLRGKKISCGAQINYPLGKNEGIFPKYLDRTPYVAPIDHEPIGVHRSEKEFVQELLYAFRGQGLDLYQLRILQKENREEGCLWVKIINLQYRKIDEVRERLQQLLGALTPDEISEIRVVIEEDGVALHEFFFRMNQLRKYQKKELGKYEMEIVSPLREASSFPSLYDASLLYHRKKSIWTWTFHPRTISYFGSTKGKVKCDAGFVLDFQGYLFDQMFYDCLLSYILFSNAGNLSDRDLPNPSRLINVRSDAVRYNQSNSFHVDQLYLQKSWNMSRGFFSRLSGGYFEVAYGGIASEILYYPVGSSWAMGAQIAGMLKRNYSGMGFSKTIRKLQGDRYEQVSFKGLQYFFEFYYDCKPLEIVFKMSVGQFLARDKGVQFEWSRYFKSGFVLTGWYTVTNGKDRVNGKRYFDKGFAFSIPLDMFLNKSSRTRLGYGMSAWLRDVGARARTGKPLFPTIYFSRQNF